MARAEEYRWSSAHEHWRETVCGYASPRVETGHAGVRALLILLAAAAEDVPDSHVAFLAGVLVDCREFPGENQQPRGPNLYDTSTVREAT